MKVYLGADHRGFALKETIKNWLSQQGIQTEDVGAFEVLPQDDYVDYARSVGEKVASEERKGLETRGILFCANGVGINIAANKVNGIRAALGFSPQQIQTARHDDDINVLALPAEYVTEDEAREIIQKFLETNFDTSQEKYTRRIEEIKQLEQGKA